MQKVSIAIGIFILALGGWFAYQHFMAAEADIQAEQEPRLVASFSCEEGSYFTAEFPNQNELNIVVDGIILRTLPHAPESGQRFEDKDFSYVFSGETVTLTDKQNQKSAVCHQPSGTPVDFGN